MPALRLLLPLLLWSCCHAGPRTLHCAASESCCSSCSVNEGSQRTCRSGPCTGNLNSGRQVQTLGHTPPLLHQTVPGQVQTHLLSLNQTPPPTAHPILLLLPYSSSSESRMVSTGGVPWRKKSNTALKACFSSMRRSVNSSLLRVYNYNTRVIKLNIRGCCSAVFLGEVTGASSHLCHMQFKPEF